MPFTAITQLFVNTSMILPGCFQLAGLSMYALFPGISLKGLLAGILILLCSEQAMARSITMQTTMTFSVTQDHVKVEIKGTNKGSEYARHVHAILYLFDTTIISESTDNLPIHASHSFYFSIAIPKDKKGDFPIVGEIVFHDTTGNVYSALTASVLALLSVPGKDLIEAHIPEISMVRQGFLTVGIQNRASQALMCVVNLFLPKALTTPDSKKRITLEGHGKAKLDFKILNRYPLNTADYSVFSVLTWIDDGISRVLKRESRIKTVKAPNRLIIARKHWLKGGILLIPLWLGILWINRKKSPSR